MKRDFIFHVTTTDNNCRRMFVVEVAYYINGKVTIKSFPCDTFDNARDVKTHVISDIDDIVRREFNDVPFSSNWTSQNTIDEYDLIHRLACAWFKVQIKERVVVE